MVRGIFLFSLLVLVEGVQLVIILGLISSHIPLGLDPLALDLFPLYKDTLKPNRQMTIYRLFIAVSVLAQTAGVWAFQKKLAERPFQAKIKQLLIADSFWVFLQCFVLFKYLVYGHPVWAMQIFYGVLAVSVLSRIFWPEVLKLGAKFEAGLKDFVETPLDKRPMAVSWLSVFWMPLFVLVEAIQLTVGFNWLMAILSKPLTPLHAYAVFVGGIFFFGFILGRKGLDSKSLRGFIVAETLITYLILSALFKMAIFDYRGQLATHAFHMLLVLAVINKICWPLLWPRFQNVYAFLIHSRERKAWRIGEDLAVVLMIGILLYLPDIEGVAAKIFVGEQFYHINSFVMAPAWGVVSGGVPNVDFISHYGLGVPIILAALTKLFGGFNYIHMLLVFMWVCIIYFVLCYFFLRAWLGSFALSVAAILVAIKTQMFFTLTLPQPLTYPNGTPVRFMFDILFFWAIWGHLCKQRVLYLWLAAASCALSFFYMIETGAYLTLAFYGYLLINLFIPPRQKIVSTVLWVLSVPVMTLALFGLTVGHHLLEAQFWYNMLEPARYITVGLNMGPFDGGLQYGQFWDLLIGFCFPLLFVGTMLVVGSLCLLQKLPRRHLMVIVICLYGLGAHHYYVAMATANNYYTRAIPFVFVLFYWVQWGLSLVSRRLRFHLSATLIVFSAYALLTNHHYLSYPNALNFSRNPLVDPLVAEELPTRLPYYFHKAGWDVPEEQKVPFNSLGEKDEGIITGFSSDEAIKDYYRAQRDFGPDAAFIDSLTMPHAKVALISSFEVEILMQADRRPLFYYFHFLYSRPMRARNFPTDELYAKRQWQRMIDALEQSPKSYVFMERIFLQSQVPANYSYDHPGLMALLSYIKAHYEPYRTGKYLVAMKRK